MSNNTNIKLIKSFQVAFLRLCAVLHPTRSPLPLFVGTLALLLAAGSVVAGAFFSQGHAALASVALLFAIILCCTLAGYRIADVINMFDISERRLAEQRLRAVFFKGVVASIVTLLAADPSLSPDSEILS